MSIKYDKNLSIFNVHQMMWKCVKKWYRSLCVHSSMLNVQCFVVYFPFLFSLSSHRRNNIECQWTHEQKVFRHTSIVHSFVLQKLHVRCRLMMISFLWYPLSQIENFKICVKTTNKHVQIVSVAREARKKKQKKICKKKSAEWCDAMRGDVMWCDVYENL